MRNLGALDVRQSDAVDARIELDLRIGAAFTRFQSLTLNRFADLQGKTISYGTRAALLSRRGLARRPSSLRWSPARVRWRWRWRSQGRASSPRLALWWSGTFASKTLCRSRSGSSSSRRPRCVGGVQCIRRASPLAPSPRRCVPRSAAVRVARQDGITTVFRWQRDRLFDHQLTTILYEKCTEQPQAVVSSLQCKPTSRWCVQRVVWPWPARRRVRNAWRGECHRGRAQAPAPADDGGDAKDPLGQAAHVVGRHHDRACAARGACPGSWPTAHRSTCRDGRGPSRLPRASTRGALSAIRAPRRTALITRLTTAR